MTSHIRFETSQCYLTHEIDNVDIGYAGTNLMIKNAFPMKKIQEYDVGSCVMSSYITLPGLNTILSVNLRTCRVRLDNYRLVIKRILPSPRGLPPMDHDPPPMIPSPTKFVVKAHDHADNWFEQSR